MPSSPAPRPGAQAGTPPRFSVRRGGGWSHLGVRSERGRNAWGMEARAVSSNDPEAPPSLRGCWLSEGRQRAALTSVPQALQLGAESISRRLIPMRLMEAAGGLRPALERGELVSSSPSLIAQGERGVVYLTS